MVTKLGSRQILAGLGGAKAVHKGLLRYAEEVALMESMRAELTKKYPNKWVAQGNRILLEEDPKEVSFIPTSFEPLPLDADLGAVVLAQEVQGEPPQHCEILGRLAYSAFVFPKRHIQHPVLAVLDAPMGPYRRTQRLRFPR